jgi:hypothetical protein
VVHIHGSYRRGYTALTYSPTAMHQGFSDMMRLMGHLGWFAEDALPADAATWVRATYTSAHTRRSVRVDRGGCGVAGGLARAASAVASGAGGGAGVVGRQGSRGQGERAGVRGRSQWPW